MRLQHWLLALALLASAGLAGGHGGTRADIRLDIKAPQVSGLRIELHQDSFAPQLVLSNHSGKLLEIADQKGRSFLRIGPGGVRGDHAAEAFYASLTPGGSPAPRQRLSPKADWQTVSAEPAFGWFDPRLSFEHRDVPHQIKHSLQPKAFANWRIAAKLDGRVLPLEGHFIFQPTPLGMTVARLEPPNLGHVEVTLVPGPKPAFFLTNRGDALVEVLDAKRKPFLRITKDSVWGDASNAAFRAGSSLVWGTSTGWQKLSDSGSTSWLEPRAAFAGQINSTILRAGKQATLQHWSVPLQVGGKPKELRGAVDWLPSATPKH